MMPRVHADVAQGNHASAVVGKRVSRHPAVALAGSSQVALWAGRTGQRWDNVLAESFLASIKGELIDLQTWPTRTMARRAIVEHIGWYNGTRLQSALRYRSPVLDTPCTEGCVRLCQTWPWPDDLGPTQLIVHPLKLVGPQPAATGPAGSCLEGSGLLARGWPSRDLSPLLVVPAAAERRGGTTWTPTSRGPHSPARKGRKP